METFYDIGTGDLKDIWDSDLDPSDALKLSSDTDMQDWFLERDIKMPQVILHDKLISDAALLGTLPIKTEHSYSLNSDGDSMPDSPRSLHAKMDDMDDECYPAISMNTATSNNRRLIDNTSLHTDNTISQSISSPINITLRHGNKYQSHILRSEKQQLIQEQLTNNILNGAQLETASISSSDVDIDDSCIKDEPMSPISSCPPSPSSQTYGISLNMANVAAFTNTDLVFEHKNGSLQLSPASQSLLKSQQIILSGTSSSSSSSTTLTNIPQQRIVMPKLSIKMEQQQSSHLFGLPPTPPSSLPSDESEGNQSPEHHLISPMSPPTVQQQQTTISSSLLSSTTPGTSAGTTSLRRNTIGGGGNNSLSNSPTTNSTSNLGTNVNRAGYSGSSTRQPIHTPLISSQPKGSTGTLILTEEEKRTLLAEGYPIPTRLPLTKAEEKSLKKIRRKIKNKISAQESRRKKKEYMDQLERKVEILVTENSDYRKRVESLEDSNASLMSQLAKLQALLNRQNVKKN